MTCWQFALVIGSVIVIVGNVIGEIVYWCIDRNRARSFRVAVLPVAKIHKEKRQ